MDAVAAGRHGDSRPTERPMHWLASTAGRGHRSLAIGDLLNTPHMNQLPFIQYDANPRTGRTGGHFSTVGAWPQSGDIMDHITLPSVDDAFNV